MLPTKPSRFLYSPPDTRSIERQRYDAMAAREAREAKEEADEELERTVDALPPLKDTWGGSRYGDI